MNLVDTVLLVNVITEENIRYHHVMFPVIYDRLAIVYSIDYYLY